MLAKYTCKMHTVYIRIEAAPRIVAARMRDANQVGVVTIASGTRSLVRGKTKAEDSLGLVLLQHGSFVDNRISITRSEVFIITS